MGTSDCACPLTTGDFIEAARVHFTARPPPVSFALGRRPVWFAKSYAPAGSAQYTLRAAAAAAKFWALVRALEVTGRAALARKLDAGCRVRQCRDPPLAVHGVGACSHLQCAHVRSARARVRSSHAVRSLACARVACLAVVLVADTCTSCTRMRRDCAALPRAQAWRLYNTPAIDFDLHFATSALGRLEALLAAPDRAAFCMRWLPGADDWRAYLASYMAGISRHCLRQEPTSCVSAAGTCACSPRSSTECLRTAAGHSVPIQSEWSSS